MKITHKKHIELHEKKIKRLKLAWFLSVVLIIMGYCCPFETLAHLIWKGVEFILVSVTYYVFFGGIEHP